MANAEVVRAVQSACPKKKVLVIPRPIANTRMSVLEFMEWLGCLDENGDGNIRRSKVEKGIRRLGLWFINYKSKQAMIAVDTNDNDIIDTDEEFKQLIEYVREHWGLTIYED